MSDYAGKMSNSWKGEKPGQLPGKTLQRVKIGNEISYLCLLFCWDGFKRHFSVRVLLRCSLSPHLINFLPSPSNNT